MHKHTLDWLRQAHLTGHPSDPALAELRWRTGEQLAEKPTRQRIVELLELFLFEVTSKEVQTRFTDEILKLDSAFPVSNNIQELRLVAGLAIASAFEAGSSSKADAFALGLRGADFPAGRVGPVVPAILEEAELYLRAEANKVRPGDFTINRTDPAKQIIARGKVLEEAEKVDDQAKVPAALGLYRRSVAAGLTELHGSIVGLSSRVEQLAEEAGLLWWVTGEYCETLNLSTHEISAQAYALIAAAEAMQRTKLIPPPPSIVALLSRALRSCKQPKKKPLLRDFFHDLDQRWMDSLFRKATPSECKALTPLSLGVATTRELGAEAAASALPRICRGFPSALSLSPLDAARQFYTELAFFEALGIFSQPGNAALPN